MKAVMNVMKAAGSYIGSCFSSSEAGQVNQPDRSPGEAGEQGNAPGENTQGIPRPGNNTMRTRIARLFDTKKVPYPPALQFGGGNGEWNNDVAREICANWVDSQLAH